MSAKTEVRLHDLERKVDKLDARIAELERLISNLSKTKKGQT